ncbi:MAG: TetR/AcrR family transcriptional regulator [Acidobacteria bacterium]|nr:TetR/AcrR family transcriptional regulator [Acidobacteriota bacterium]
MPSTRRTPLQARSNETVNTILDAASSLLGRIPFEQITTSRIADTAGLSVGALYRFYNDKQEIFDAIAVRELAEFRQKISDNLKARQLLFTPRKSLDRILDSYIAFLDAKPHFRELALGRHISDQTREQQSGADGILQGLLIEKLGLKPGKTIQIRIRIAAEVGDRLIDFAYRQPTPKDRQVILSELKELLAAYLLRL